MEAENNVGKMLRRHLVKKLKTLEHKSNVKIGVVKYFDLRSRFPYTKDNFSQKFDRFGMIKDLF